MDTREQTSDDGRQTYEAPSLTVIGPAKEFTFGSTLRDQSDHSVGRTGGHKI